MDEKESSGGGGRPKIFLWTALALAMLAATVYVAVELGGDAGAGAEKARDLEEVRRLRARARARGEPVFWEEFVTNPAPEALAATEHARTLLQRSSNRYRDGNDDDRTMGLFLSGGDHLEKFRAELDALPHPPLEYAATDFALLDRILDGPAPAYRLDPTLTRLSPTVWEHVSGLRVAAFYASQRAKILAVRENGTAAMASLERALALFQPVEGDPGLIGMFVNMAIRAIICRGANKVCLLDPPSPEVLRRVAARVEAWPSLEAIARHAYTFERAAFERFFFLDPDWTRSVPMDDEFAARIYEASEFPSLRHEPLSKEEKADFINQTVKRTPALRPGRNIRTMYREMDEILSRPDFLTADHDAALSARAEAGRRSLRSVEELPAWLKRVVGTTPALRRIGSRDPDIAPVAYGFLSSPTRALSHVSRDVAMRRAFAYVLRLYADRLEGKPYPVGVDAPTSPITGQPFSQERKEGFLCIHWREDPSAVRHDGIRFRLPLFPDDEGYDPEHAWRFGHEPEAESNTSE